LHNVPVISYKRRPGFEPGSGQVGFVAGKVDLGQVFSEYFGFPCQSSFHQILHSHNHLAQVQYARSGRRAEWTQFELHPPLRELYKDCFRHSKVDMRQVTLSQQGDLISLLLFFQNKGSGLKIVILRVVSEYPEDRCNNSYPRRSQIVVF
jgi:hypothetical protein